MLRVTPFKETKGLVKYFEAELANTDYFDEGGTSPGVWGGKGAELLRLAGTVVKKQFLALSTNRHPETGDRLTPRMKANRRPAYDFTFSVPKSVSVMFAVGGDKRLLVAFTAAVDRTMRILEAAAQTRVRRDGRDIDRTTSDMVWARFVHHTARPVDGIADPQLHAHCIVFNTTYDGEETRWKALQVGDIKSCASYYEALFTAELAKLVRELGYETVGAGRFWEIGGISRDIIDRFSRRTREIADYAKSHGIDSPEELADLGRRTRKSKSKSAPAGETRADWGKRLTDDERERLARIRRESKKHGKSGATRESERPAAEPERRKRERRPKAPTLEEVITHAKDRLFERSAVVLERDFVAEAVRIGQGEHSPMSIRAVMGSNGLLVREKKGRKVVTTESVLKEEAELIRLAKDGQGRVAPLAKSVQSQPDLDQGQNQAVRFVLTSRDRLSLVDGRTGTGKTTILNTIKATLNRDHRGMPLTVIAPTARASRGMLREAGFSDATTVSAFLASPELQSAAKRGLIWVDEAGMLGTRDGLRLLEAANRLGARMVWAGSTKQHPPLTRGSAMTVLQSHGGIQSAWLGHIRRQHGAFKEVASLLNEGRTTEAFGRMDQLGMVRQMSTSDVFKFAARELVERTRKKQSVVAIAPTRREVECVTAEVRSQLKHRKKISKARMFSCLVPVDGAEADRSCAGFYRKGYIVQFHRNAPSFKAGSRWKVVGKVGNSVFVRRGLAVFPLPLSKASRFAVFKQTSIELGIGEQIVLGRSVKAASRGATIWADVSGRKAKRLFELQSGTTYTVKGFDRAGDIVLSNNLVLPKEHGHVRYGYCMTSVAAQGQTVDHAVLIHTRMSGRAANQQQVLVSATRARDGVTILTDDKDAFVAAAARDSRGMTAHAAMEEELAGRDATREEERGRRGAAERMTVATQEHRAGPDRERDMGREM